MHELAGEIVRNKDEHIFKTKGKGHTVRGALGILECLINYEHHTLGLNVLKEPAYDYEAECVEPVPIHVILDP